MEAEMRNIDTDKLSKEMNDTLVHRSCVMRSGQYLSRYLIHRNRSVDAIRLIGRCSVHDMSKIQNTEEFMLLASIVDQMPDMQNIEHVLSEEQINAITLHWQRNSHHPEYYDNPNDMSDMDLLEMACDCHARSKQYGTDLIEYITIQQELRFHFDREHFRKLRAYSMALVEMTKDDDYSQLLNPDTVLCFDLKDSTMKLLETFDDSCYPDTLKTERLYLIKEENPDFASVEYTCYLHDEGTEVGQLLIKCNGYIDYKFYENYKEQGYEIESIRRLIEASYLTELFLSIKRENNFGKEMAEEMGFKQIESSPGGYVFRLKKNR
jgi:hypothetical protein